MISLSPFTDTAGEESNYELAPLFYHISNSSREAIPDAERFAIRINSNRSGEETIFLY